MLHDVGKSGYGVQCDKKYFTASLQVFPGFYKTLAVKDVENEDDKFEVKFDPSYSVEGIEGRLRPIIVTAKSVKKEEPVMFEASICVCSDKYDNESDPLKLIPFVKYPKDEAPEDVLELPKPAEPKPEP